MKRLTLREANGCVLPGFENNGVNGCYDIPDAEWLEESIDRLALIEDSLGGDYDLDRLRELVEADRDGRCITHQVKVGDGVWFTTYGEMPVYFTINSVFLQIDGTRECFYYQVINSFGNSDYFYGEDLNKTVFITHEAAEAALKAREQDG